MWLPPSWSQDGCPSSNNSICVPGKKKKKGREKKACVSEVCSYLWGKQWLSLEPPQQACDRLLLAGNQLYDHPWVQAGQGGRALYLEHVSQTCLGVHWQKWRGLKVGGEQCLPLYYFFCCTAGKTASDRLQGLLKATHLVSKRYLRTSLDVQCLGIHFPIQSHQIRSLVRKQIPQACNAARKKKEPDSASRTLIYAGHVCSDAMRRNTKDPIWYSSSTMM